MPVLRRGKEKRAEKVDLAAVEVRRKFAGRVRIPVMVIGVALSLFQLYTGVFGIYRTAVVHRAVHLTLVLIVFFLLYPASRRSPYSKWCLGGDVLLAAVALVVVGYVVVGYEAIANRIGALQDLTSFDLVVGVLLILLVLEACRRFSLLFFVLFGLMGLISIVGRLGFGSLGDHLARAGVPPVYARRSMYAASGLLMGLGTLILSTVSAPAWLWAWAFVFGVGYGAHVPQTASITGDMFGRKHLGLIMTLVGTAPGLAGIIGPIFAGRIYDLSGSYGVALQVSVLLCLLVIAFSLLIVPPRRITPRADETCYQVGR